MNHLTCPDCGSSNFKLNGFTHYGKQNHKCKDCPRQFVADSQHISDDKRQLIRKLLLERLSLCGICRVAGVSLRWLLSFIFETYSDLPDDLNIKLPEASKGSVYLFRLEAEADEMWSFVGSKANKQWIWIAIDTQTRQVIAFYVGDRSRDSARKLWALIPEVYRREAHFDTDDWEAYKGVIPYDQHEVCAKGSGRTNIIERFNCTLRQRVSRLVRSALSFSKSLANHIGAIKYFICYYNQEVMADV